MASHAAQIMLCMPYLSILVTGDPGCLDFCSDDQSSSSTEEERNAMATQLDHGQSGQPGLCLGN